MDGDVAQALVVSAIAAVILWRGIRPVGDVELQRFVDRFAVQMEAGDDLFVRARLRRSRGVRMGAAAIGVLVAGVPAYMNLIDPVRSADFANAVFGSAWIVAPAAAALFAEVMVVQGPPHVRRAAIEVRRASDYVSSRWISRLVIMGVLATLGAAIGLGVDRGDRVELIAALVGGVGAPLAGWTGLRQIVRRPRLAPDGALRQIDDALRSYGAHHLVGAALALAAASVSMAAHQLIVTGWPTVVAALVGYYGLISWWNLARDVRWPIGKAHVTT